jgi:thiol-disulfide isomerase/thioredoxin
MRSNATVRRALAIAFASLACAFCMATRGGPAAGQVAPPLVIAALDGSTFDLSKQRGHIVIVNFWATWCPPCRQEMPLLNAFAERHHADGIVLLGLSVDRRRDRNDVVEAMRPFHYAAGIADGAKANGFGPPQALPITYVVDAEGVVRTILLPGRAVLTEAALEGAVAPLLAQSHPAE